MATLLERIRDGLAKIFVRPPSGAVKTLGALPAPARRVELAHELIEEPNTRTWIEWTPDLVQAAEIQCDGGSLRMAADLCHAMAGDDRVIATLGVRTRGLLGLPVTFEAGADKRRSKRVLRAIEADEDWWQAAPEDTLAELLRWGVLLGVGFAKLVPTESLSGRTLLRLEVWDPRWFRWDWTARAWMVLTASGAEVPLAADGRWVILTPYGEHAPWQRGVWRACSRWWLLKHYARNDWAQHGQVKASGVFVVSNTSDPASGQQDLSPTQRARLAAQLTNLGRDAGLVLPRGLDLKLVESTAKNYETFGAQIDAANTGIAIAVLGQNLTTEVQGGSYAAAQVHQRVADYLRRADAECLSTTLRTQVLTWWAAYNFGDPAVAPWPRWKIDPEADAASVGAAYKALGDGIASLRDAVPEGQALDLGAILERAGVPLVDAPDVPEALPEPALTVGTVSQAVTGGS